jgi:hypothetical protein
VKKRSRKEPRRARSDKGNVTSRLARAFSPKAFIREDVKNSEISEETPEESLPIDEVGTSVETEDSAFIADFTAGIPASSPDGGEASRSPKLGVSWSDYSSLDTDSIRSFKKNHSGISTVPEISGPPLGASAVDHALRFALIVQMYEELPSHLKRGIYELVRSDMEQSSKIEEKTVKPSSLPTISRAKVSVDTTDDSSGLEEKSGVSSTPTTSEKLRSLPANKLRERGLVRDPETGKVFRRQPKAMRSAEYLRLEGAIKHSISELKEITTHFGLTPSKDGKLFDSELREVEEPPEITEAKLRVRDAKHAFKAYKASLRDRDPPDGKSGEGN